MPWPCPPATGERHRVPLCSQLLGNEIARCSPPFPLVIALSFFFQKPAPSSPQVSPPGLVTSPESSPSLAGTSPAVTISPSGIPKRLTGKDTRPCPVGCLSLSPVGFQHQAAVLMIALSLALWLGAQLHQPLAVGLGRWLHSPVFVLLFSVDTRRFKMIVWLACIFIR